MVPPRCSVPAMLWYTAVNFRRMGPSFAAKEVAEGRMTTNVTENLTGIRTVREHRLTQKDSFYFNWSLDVPPLPSTAPPSLARGHAAPASEPGSSAPAALPPHTDETTPSGLSVAERALAALATLPSAPPESAPEPEPEPEPVAASTPSKALPPSETPPAPPPLPADAPAADDLISTVPSRFADDDERPPHAEDQRPTTAIAPALTEAELLARHQRQARQKSRRPQADTPEFIRQAERQALWRNPGVRGVLTGLCLALSLTLAAQVAHQQRDWLAAHLRGRWSAGSGGFAVVTHDRWFTREFTRYLIFGEDGKVYESPKPVWSY